MLIPRGSLLDQKLRTLIMTFVSIFALLSSVWCSLAGSPSSWTPCITWAGTCATIFEVHFCSSLCNRTRALGSSVSSHSWLSKKSRVLHARFGFESQETASVKSPSMGTFPILLKVESSSAPIPRRSIFSLIGKRQMNIHCQISGVQWVNVVTFVGLLQLNL